MPKEDTTPLRDFVYWPNFELSPDGKEVTVGTGAGIDVQVTILNSLVQCIGQPMSEKCRWFKMKINELVAGSYLMFGVNCGCLSGIPQWNRAMSVRYVSDTGGVFSQGIGYHTYIKYSKGDEIVCYIEQFFPDKCLVNFFKNGVLIFRHWALLPKDNIYATIGAKTGPVSLSVEWPSTKAQEFIFDSEAVRHWIRVPQLLVDDVNKTFKLDKKESTKISYGAQGPRPLNKKSSYFEIELKRATDDGFGLGLTTAGFDPYYAPGWGDAKTLPSYGYHGDDGSIRRNMSTGQIMQEEDWKCSMGDRIGCGIVIDDKPVPTRSSSEQAVYIYATKNGKVIHVLGDILPLGGYYPTVFLQKRGDEIKVRYPVTAPMVDLDLENHMRIQRNLLSNFIKPYSVILPNFDNDGGAEVIFPNMDMEDPEERCIVSIQQSFKANNYFQVTCDDMSFLNIGLVAYDANMKAADCCGIDINPLGVRIKSDSDDSNQIVQRLETSNPISVLLREICDNVVTVYFFVGDIQDLKVLGRTILNLETPKSNVFPSVTFEGEERKVHIDWMEHEVPNFVVEDISTWLLPIPQLKVEDTTISLSSDAQWCPVCVQSTAPLSNTGRCYFEITLEESEYDTFPGVGVCSLTTKTDAVLGLERNVNTAAAFYPHKKTIHCGKATVLEEEFSVTKSAVVGCHVIFPDKTDRHSYAIVKFYFNGKFVDNIIIQVQQTGLYAAVCFEYEGDAVSIKFDSPVPSIVETVKEMTDLIEAQKERDRPIERQRTMIQQKSTFGLQYDAKGSYPTIRGRPIQAYISHTNQDSKIGNILFKELSSRGFLVETTAWNATLTAKKNKIQECDAVVLCMSQQKSKEQELELGSIVEEEKIVIPITLEKGMWPPSGKFKKFNKTFTKYDDNVFECMGPDINYNLLSEIIDDAVNQRRRYRPGEEQIMNVAPVRTQIKNPTSTHINQQKTENKIDKSEKITTKDEKKSGTCTLL